MKVKAAESELEQYIATRIYECPGTQWTHVTRTYDWSDVNNPKVIGRTWEAGWSGSKRHVRMSLQLCIPGVAERFPSPQEYVAQMNWTKMIRRLLSHEPTWRTVPEPIRYDTPTAVTAAARAAGLGHFLPAKTERLGVRFIAALRATGPGWQRDVLQDWRKPRKRCGKKTVAA